MDYSSLEEAERHCNVLTQSPGIATPDPKRTKATPKESLEEPAKKPQPRDLASEFAAIEKDPMLNTPLRVDQKALAVQLFARQSFEYHSGNGTSHGPPTPLTQSLLTSVARLESAGPNALVESRSNDALQLGSAYLEKKLGGCFTTDTSTADTTSTVDATSMAVTKPSHRADNKKSTAVNPLPSNSIGVRQRGSLWDNIPMSTHESYACAIVSTEGLKPNNALKKRTLNSASGHRVHTFVCKHDSQNCLFRARLFWKTDHPSKSVKVQVAAEHSCGHVISWQQSLADQSTKEGLHPVLKHSLEEELNDLHIHNLPGPESMLRRMLQKHYHDESLFPDQFKEVVCQQVKGYWQRLRLKTIKNAGALQTILKFDTDYETYRQNHTLHIPKGYKIPSDLRNFKRHDIRELAKQLFANGKTNTLRHETEARQEENEMFVLMYPPLDDPDYGAIMSFAIAKDNNDQDGTVRKRLVVVSSVYLLFFAVVAHYKFGNLVMGNIDGGHGWSSLGAKLLVFIFQSYRRKGNQGSEYTHTGLPLALADSPVECQEAALFLLCGMGYTCRELFGIKLDVKGGLISDNAEAYINAFKRFFPNRLCGQCNPHRMFAFNDSRGKRKKGATPRYSKHANSQTYLKETCRVDASMMAECITDPMKDTFTSLSLQAWHMANEAKVAAIFFKSYVKNPDQRRWRYNEFGNHGLTPQSNSLERKYLEAQGTAQFEGLCQWGLHPNRMLNCEMPKLVWSLSARSCQLEQAFRISDEKALKSDSGLLAQVSKLTESDRLSDGNGGWFYNNVGYERTIIDQDRLQRRHMSLHGLFPSKDPHKRQEFFDGGSSLCHVTMVPRSVAAGDDAGVPEWHGTCVQFWKTTACPHTFHAKYGPVNPLERTELKSKKAKAEHKRKVEQQFKPISHRYTYPSEQSGFLQTK